MTTEELEQLNHAVAVIAGYEAANIGYKAVCPLSHYTIKGTL